MDELTANAAKANTEQADFLVAVDGFAEVYPQDKYTGWCSIYKPAATSLA